MGNADIMKYTDFSSVEDYLCDEYFKDWVKLPNKDSDLFWKDFMQNHPDQISLISRAKELLLLIEFKDSFLNDPTDEEIENIRLDIVTNTRAHPPPKKGGLMKSLYFKWQTYAVAAGIAFGIATVDWSTFFNTKSSPSLKTEWIVKETKKGQTLDLILADGSKIKLNRGSRIQYPKFFNSNERTVHLIGEAFFNVEKDKSKPFQVLTTHSKTIVTGTSFNIRAFPSKSTTVAVFTGSVEVENPKDVLSKKIQLLPSQKVTIDKESGKFLKSSFDLEKDFGWNRGVLVFDGITLEEVIMRLQYWYGVEITVDGNIEDQLRKIHGRFKNNSLEYVLKALVYYADVKAYEINGSQIILYL